MRIAIVHEWFVSHAGSEKVVEQFLKIWPHADIFSVVDFLTDDERGFLQGKHAKTTFIQKLPKAKTKYRSYLPLMPLAIEQLDLSGYDVILSSSHAVSKGVITGPDQLHISYVHSPIRYAWDLQHQYLSEAGLDKGFKSWVARLILHYIRIWDQRTAHGVDHFLANSRFIARRVRKAYGRASQVIYPPVDTSGFDIGQNKESFYLTASRMVPYKKIPLIVQAFAQMPDKQLIVIGEGTEFAKIKTMAPANITLLGYQSFEVLKDHMQRAKAFVFAAEEDFGITPVEAQACGTPVIAFGKGGALETVLDASHGPLQTGLFFYQQTPESIVDAINQFEKMPTIDPMVCRQNSLRFSPERFRGEMSTFVDARWREFCAAL